MAKSPRLYTRLTRPTTSVGSYQSLWLAPDHLLVVGSTGYNEEYRRIQFRDIQGIFTIGSERRLYWSLPWAVLALFSGLFVLNTVYHRQNPYVSGALLTIAAIVLLWNQLLGPGCKVFVVTGVQTLRLPSIVRRRKAQKVLARLQPLIAMEQAFHLTPASPPPDSPPVVA